MDIIRTERGKRVGDQYLVCNGNTRVDVNKTVYIASVYSISNMELFYPFGANLVQTFFVFLVSL